MPIWGKLSAGIWFSEVILDYDFSHFTLLSKVDELKMGPMYLSATEISLSGFEFGIFVTPCALVQLCSFNCSSKRFNW